MPESVQPLIAEQIEALSSEDRQTLQLAAVIGSEFPVDLLRILLRHEGLEDNKSLPSLAKKDLLVNVDAPFAKFRHALIQKVAYSSLPKRRLWHLHGFFVDITESLDLPPRPLQDELIGVSRRAVATLDTGGKGVHRLRASGIRESCVRR